MRKHRTYRIRFLLPAVIFLAALALVFAQPNFDEIEITTTKLAEGVYMLMGSGGNIGVSVGEDGVLLIDDQYASSHAKDQDSSCRHQRSADSFRRQHPLAWRSHRR